MHESGDLIYTLSSLWSDGCIGIQLSPLELVEKLLARVPPPRVHQVRPVIRRIMCHLKLAADPPPIAEAQLSQGRFAWSSPSLPPVDKGWVEGRVEVRPLAPTLVLPTRPEPLNAA